jgi:hypothetical protein
LCFFTPDHAHVLPLSRQVINHKKVDSLLMQWEAAIAERERAELQQRRTGRDPMRFGGKLSLLNCCAGCGCAACPDATDLCGSCCPQHVVEVLPEITVGGRGSRKSQHVLVLCLSGRSSQFPHLSINVPHPKLRSCTARSHSLYTGVVHALKCMQTVGWCFLLTACFTAALMPLQARIHDLELKIEAARRDAFTSEFTPSWFVLFKSQTAATMAASTRIYAEDSTEFQVRMIFIAFLISVGACLAPAGIAGQLLFVVGTHWKCKLMLAFIQGCSNVIPASLW